MFFAVNNEKLFNIYETLPSLDGASSRLYISYIATGSTQLVISSPPAAVAFAVANLLPHAIFLHLLLFQVILLLGHMPIPARCLAFDASAVEIVLARWPKVWTFLGCTRVVEPAVRTPLTNPTKVVLASIRFANSSATLLLHLCITL